MATDERAQLLWQREGEHEVMGGQLPLQLRVEPGIGFVLLAAGTVTVAATAREHVELAAGFTAVEQRTIGRTGAADDRLDHLLVFCGHARSEAREIVQAVGAEDLLNGAHDHRSSITVSIRA